MNCVGVAADGRVVRFPALGPLSGDFASGGGWLGIAALGAAMRGRDRRGPRTSLERLIPSHFGLARPVQVVEAFYARRFPESRLLELPPLVFRAAGEGDEAARRLLDLLADEIVAMATSALRRLRLTSHRVEVVLGGGNFRNDVPAFSDRVCAGIRAVAPGACISVLDVPPIAGAALLALDEAGATASAKRRARAELTHGRMTRAALDAARLPH
jgi:N-acetylglucosamine kinase-like BadF-type ATPase